MKWNNQISNYTWILKKKSPCDYEQYWMSHIEYFILKYQEHKSEKKPTFSKLLVIYMVQTSKIICKCPQIAIYVIESIVFSFYRISWAKCLNRDRYQFTTKIIPKVIFVHSFNINLTKYRVNEI